MKLPFGTRWPKAATGAVAAITLVAGVVVSWDESPDAVPGVRLHAGVAWVASNGLGQLTLLDGASAEVAAGVQVGRPGSALSVVQHGATGYALNRERGSVVRVDGATLDSSNPVFPVKGAKDQLAVLPTSDALYTLDTRRGLLAMADPKTLKSQGKPYRLAVRPASDGAVTDADGNLWALDDRTGDLVWFADGARRTRADAATPGGSRLTVTDGRAALLDPARRTMALLDPATGAVEQSAEVNLRADDTVAVSGSPGQRRLLISVSSQGQFLSCTFGAGSCAKPVALDSSDLGPAVEVGNRAVVPDFETGQVWIVDLEKSRVIAQRQLFDNPVRFELLTRDGVIFYNDPDSEQAGVIELDGRVRPITKYRSELLSGGPPVAEVIDGPPDPFEPSDPLGPEAGPDTQPDPPGTDTVSIAVRPRDYGMVGDEFEFTVMAGGVASITSARWTFGDSAAATGTTVRHRWDSPGTYPVGVTATLRRGQEVSAATQVVVDSPDAPPRIVRLTVEPETPRIGERVRFGAELAGGQPQSTAWTVTGDGGTVATSNAPGFEHVFTAPGNYTVSLTVTAGAASVQQSKQFTVTPEARGVRCGDTITTDAVLTQDLTCTGDVGLTIAASGVDLDLGGHTIATDEPSAVRKGIVVADQEHLEDITIRNGTVRQFQTAIEMIDVSNVEITSATISVPPVDDAVNYGIMGDRATDVRISRVTQDSYNPFEFTNGSSVAITESIIVGDIGWGWASCSNGSSCALQYTDFQTRYFGCNAAAEVDSSSLSLDLMSRLSVEQIGIGCDVLSVTNTENVELLGGLDADRNVITNNTISGNGIMLALFPVHISGNTFLNSEYSALKMQDNVQGEVTGNQFVGSGGCGIQVESSYPPLGPLEISGNQFISNGFAEEEVDDCHDGLRITGVVPGDSVVVSGNHASGNKERGINVDPESVANGIVVDGGGNTSSGDGQECRGIACS